MSRRFVSRHDDPCGLLLVDKAAGMTSHDVVDRVRRQFRFGKVGHGGTLDPMATGLLVLLIGRATKVSSQIMNSDKTYEGVMRLGITTDTEDVDGRILEQRDPSSVTREQIEASMARRRGDLWQTPPMVSAVKREGVPLYKLARRGQVVDRQPRLIHLYTFALLDFRPPDVDFRLRCSKGTYVRTLCAEIGSELGCGAFLHSLRRTEAGQHHVDVAHLLDRILLWSREAFVEHLIPLHTLLPYQPIASDDRGPDS